MRIGQGTVVFVTGGASGLGEAAIKEMHARGAYVVIADIDIALMQALHASLQERILCIPCDVTREEEVKAAIEKTVATFGALHVALASAGIIRTAPIFSSKGPLNTKIFR